MSGSNVTTSMVGLENGHIRKNLNQNEPQKYSWERRRRRIVMSMEAT